MTWERKRKIDKGQGKIKRERVREGGEREWENDRERVKIRKWESEKER